MTTAQHTGARRPRKRLRLLATLAVAGVLGTATYAFTASNTVPGSKAGDGAGTISGYTVSSIAYTLDGTNPANLASVAFTLDAAAGTVKVKLVSTGSTWYGCTNTTGNNWSCTTTGQSVQAADQLQVVATS